MALVTHEFEWALVPKTFDQFKVIGQDGLAFIPKSTVALALQTLNLNPPVNELRRAIDEADKNGDGAIDLEEFEAFVAKYQDTVTDIGRCIENFLILDTDGSGELSREEFRAGLRLAGADALTDVEFKAMWDAIDVDRSGEISVVEFTLAMCIGATREQVMAELDRRGFKGSALSAKAVGEAKRAEVVSQETAARRDEVESEEDAARQQLWAAMVDGRRKAIELQVARIERERIAAEEKEKRDAAAAEAAEKRKKEDEERKAKAATEAAEKAKAAAAAAPPPAAQQKEKPKGCCG